MVNGILPTPDPFHASGICRFCGPRRVATDLRRVAPDHAHRSLHLGGGDRISDLPVEGRPCPMPRAATRRHCSRWVLVPRKKRFGTRLPGVGAERACPRCRRMAGQAGASRIALGNSWKTKVHVNLNECDTFQSGSGSRGSGTLPTGAAGTAAAPHAVHSTSLIFTVRPSATDFSAASASARALRPSSPEGDALPLPETAAMKAAISAA